MHTCITLFSLLMVHVYIQIQDSSLVISVLKTSLERGLTVAECLQFYPLVNVTTKKGENTTEHGNKYFIMYGEQNPTNTLGELRSVCVCVCVCVCECVGVHVCACACVGIYRERCDHVILYSSPSREEREWRQWVDDHLMHSLPPNIYRTLSEARQTMAVISAKSSMTSFQRFLARNIASIALYFVGKRNAKK